MINKTNNPDFLNGFLEHLLVILNKSPNTIREYNYDLCLFFKFIKNAKKTVSIEELQEIDLSSFTIEELKKITSNDILDFLYYITINNNNKPTTRARKLSSIKAFFKYATTKADILKTNPAYNIESPKLGKRLPTYLSLEDSHKLLKTIKDEDNRNKERDYAIITLFLNCGMRLSELVGIDINAIDFSENKMTVIGKGNKQRTVYLNKACIAAINNYLTIRPKVGVSKDSEKALFLSERKNRISNRTVQHVVKKELQHAGLDINKLSTHKLRHTAATLMYQYGDVDIRALQELLGHESISTTEIYTHVENKQLRDAIENNPLSNIQN